MDEPDLEDRYNEIREQFNLPDFEELDHEFEVSMTGPSKYFLRDIRRKMQERIDDFCKILETILHPETTMVHMHECNAFTDAEKDKMFVFYSKLMAINRECTHISVLQDDQLDAKFIREINDKWENIKNELASIMAKVTNSWKKEVLTEEGIDYFG